MMSLLPILLLFAVGLLAPALGLHTIAVVACNTQSELTTLQREEATRALRAPLESSRYASVSDFEVDFQRDNATQTMLSVVQSRPLAAVVVCFTEVETSAIVMFLAAEKIPHFILMGKIISPLYTYSLAPSFAYEGLAYVQLTLALRSKRLILIMDQSVQLAGGAGDSIEVAFFSIRFNVEADLRELSKSGVVLLLSFPQAVLLEILAVAYEMGRLQSHFLIWVLHFDVDVSFLLSTAALEAWTTRLGSRADAEAIRNLLLTRTITLDPRFTTPAAAQKAIKAATGLVVNATTLTTTARALDTATILGSVVKGLQEPTVIAKQRMQLQLALEVGAFPGITGNHIALPAYAGHSAFIGSANIWRSTNRTNPVGYFQPPNIVLSQQSIPTLRHIIALKVGLVLPSALSPSSSSSSLSLEAIAEFKAAATLALEFFASRYDDIDVEIVHIDSSSKCRLGAQRMVSMGVHIVIADPRAECILEMLPVLQDAHIPQLVYAEPSSQLSGKEFLYRTLPSSSDYGAALAALINHAGYTRVGILYTSEAAMEACASEFSAAAEALGLTLARKVLMQTKASQAEAVRAISELRRGDSAVNMICAGAQDAVTIFSAAGDLSMLSPGWVWFASEEAVFPSTELGLDETTILGIAARDAQGPLYDELMALESAQGSNLAFRNHFTAARGLGIFSPGPHVAHLIDAVGACFEATERALADGAAFSEAILSNMDNFTVVRLGIDDALARMIDASTALHGVLGAPLVFNETTHSGPALFDVIMLWQAGSVQTIGEVRDKHVNLTTPILWGGRSSIAPLNRPAVVRELRVLFASPWLDSRLADEHQAAFSAAIAFLHEQAGLFGNVRLIPSLFFNESSASVSDQALCKEITHAVIKGDVDMVAFQGPDFCVHYMAETLMETQGDASAIIISVGDAGDTGISAIPEEEEGGHNQNPPPNLFHFNPMKDAEASALAELVCYFRWKHVSVIRPKLGLYDAMVHSLDASLRSACGASVSADTSFDPFALGALDTNMDALRRSDTAVFVMLAYTHDQVTAIVQAAQTHNLIGPHWTWLCDESVMSIVAENILDLAPMSGFLGLLHTSVNSLGVRQMSFLSLNDDEGAGKLFRSTWTGVNDNGLPAPSMYSVELFASVAAVYDSLAELIESGNVTYAECKEELRPKLRSSLVHFVGDGMVGDTSVVEKVRIFGDDRNGWPLFHIANVIEESSQLIGFARVAEPGQGQGSRDTVSFLMHPTWSNGERTVPSWMPLVILPLRVLVVLPEEHATPLVLASLNLTAVFIQEAHSQVQLEWQMQTYTRQELCEDVAHRIEEDLNQLHAVVHVHPRPSCVRAWEQDNRLAGVPVHTLAPPPLQGEHLGIQGHASSLSAHGNNTVTSEGNSTGTSEGNSTGTSPRASTGRFYLLPSISAEAKALAAIVEYFGWSRVGVFTIDTPSSAQDRALQRRVLVESLRASGVGVCSDITIRVADGAERSQSDVNSVFAASGVTRDHCGVHVVIAASDDLPSVTAAISASGMDGAGWTWIMSDLLRTNFSTPLSILEGQPLLVGAAPQGLTFTSMESHSSPEARAFQGIRRSQDENTGLVPLYNAFGSLVHALALGIADGKIRYSTTLADTRQALIGELEQMTSAAYGIESLINDLPFVFSAETWSPPVQCEIRNLYRGNMITVGTFTEEAGVHLDKVMTWAGGLTTSPSSEAPRAASSALSAPAIVGLAVGLCVLVLLLAALAYRRQSGKKATSFAMDLSKQMNSVGGTIVPQELPRGCVSFEGTLGSGSFGEVYKATIKHAGVPPYSVAIKALQESCEEEAEDEFLFEACMTAQFDDSHVTALVGIVTVGEPKLMVLQYAEHGSLLEFVKQRKGFLELSLVSKMLMGRDIAKGMAHIGSKGIVHRDLAARNVLLGSNFQCKVADFGHSRRLGEDGKYTSPDTGKVAVRWAAPESLGKREYSIPSDMWSYGITLHEVFTSGELPYEGKSNKEVWMSVMAGMHLRRPASCPLDLFTEIFLNCWAMQPECRPSFQTVVDALERRVNDETERQSSDAGVVTGKNTSVEFKLNQQQVELGGRGLSKSASHSSSRSHSGEQHYEEQKGTSGEGSSERSSSDNRSQGGSRSPRQPCTEQKMSFRECSPHRSFSASTVYNSPSLVLQNSPRRTSRPEIATPVASRQVSASNMSVFMSSTATSVDSSGSHYIDMGDMSKFDDESSALSPPLWVPSARRSGSIDVHGGSREGGVHGGSPRFTQAWMHETSELEEGEESGDECRLQRREAGQADEHKSFFSGVTAALGLSKQALVPKKKLSLISEEPEAGRRRSSAKSGQRSTRASPLLHAGVTPRTSCSGASLRMSHSAIETLEGLCEEEAKDEMAMVAATTNSPIPAPPTMAMKITMDCDSEAARRRSWSSFV